ncbi:hypothetical protein M9Y10_034660 [Tritrichomonas musculus]|uniref:Uncharacterized protein n=1 Tax=Tritrichomonas musculus TaxID=1915356 RepID=A0ABR2KGE9_9EUKA
MTSRKDTVTISIQDLISNEEEDIERVDFELLSKKFSVPLYQLMKYCKVLKNNNNNNDLQNTISDISRKLVRCQQDGNLKERSINLFFDFLEERVVTISSDEYWDLCRLSKIFEIRLLEKFLKQYSNMKSEDIDFQINLINEYERVRIGKNDSETDDEIFFRNEYISSIEKNFKGKLDECFLRANFCELPTATVYRLLELNQGERVSADLLYEFISKSKEDRFPLLSFLKLQEMSEPKLEKLFHDYSKSSETMKNKYSQYLICDLVYIQQISEEKKSHERRIINLEKDKKRIEGICAQITTENDQHKKHIEKMSEEKQSLERRIIYLEKDKKRIESRCDQIIIENDQHKKHIEKMSEEQKCILSRLDAIMRENKELKGENEKKMNKKQGRKNQIEIVKTFLHRFENSEGNKLTGIYQ